MQFKAISAPRNPPKMMILRQKRLLKNHHFLMTLFFGMEYTLFLKAFRNRRENRLKKGGRFSRKIRARK